MTTRAVRVLGKPRSWWWPRLGSRFAAIWIAFAVLVLVAWAAAPASLNGSAIATNSPLVAILAIAGLGQTLVVMTGGIDLSVPSVITMSGTVMLKVSGDTDDRFVEALLLVLALSALVGFANGLAVTVFELNPLVVTLAMGQIVFGCTLWYRGYLLESTRVPPALASFATEKVWEISSLAFVALGTVLVLTILLLYTPIGRRFVAAGTNPTAARVAGIPVKRYRVGAYTLAGLLYGTSGILVAGLLLTPGENLGSPYLLTTVVIVVLGGAALTGGPARFVATLGGALFIVLLDLLLRVKGLSTGYSLLAQGIALALGMGLLANLDRIHRIGRWRQAAAKGGHPIRAAHSDGGRRCQRE